MTAVKGKELEMKHSGIGTVSTLFKTHMYFIFFLRDNVRVGGILKKTVILKKDMRTVEAGSTHIHTHIHVSADLYIIPNIYFYIYTLLISKLLLAFGTDIIDNRSEKGHQDSPLTGHLMDKAPITTYSSGLPFALVSTWFIQ